MSTGLSPNDIRSYEFPNQMRGYDKDEVREFLQQVAVALEDLKQDNLKLSMERDSVRSQLEALKQFEDTIKSAAIDARRNADTLVATAKREVNEILNKARMEAEKVVGSRAEEAKRLDEQITKLGMIKTSYQAKLKNLIESHLELIEEIQRVKAPETPKLQQPEPERSADDTAKTSITGKIAGTPNIPAAGAGEDDSFESLSFEQTAPAQDTPLEADWIRQAREANIRLADEPFDSKPSRPSNGLDVEEVTEVTRKRLETFSSEPEPAEPRRTEEANAAEQIVAIGPAPVPVAQPPVDPELAAALESYQLRHGTAPELKSKQPTAPATPSADSGRDESMRATPNDFDERNQTGRVPAQAQTDESDDTEHNLIDIDQPIGEGSAKRTAVPPTRTEVPPRSGGADPDEIARELDEVAARFEEEMDKAARS